MNDLSAWPALILTAGLATRLAPLSHVRAKAALPIAGTPLIGRVLAWLHASGVRRVVLNLHHRPDTITRVVGDGAQWNIDVRYSWEPRLLGSAGGPRRALDLLDSDRFLIINGDTLTNCNLRTVASHHVESGARITMAVVPGNVKRYGGVLVGEDNIVRGFGKKAAHAGALHFIGVQAADASVFRHLPDEEPSESIRTVYPQLIHEHPDAIRAFVSDADFLDVGSPADYFETVNTMAAREGHDLDRGTGCQIDPTALVQRTILWDRVTVSQNSHLIDCVVADDVLIPAGARYERCAIVSGRDGLTVSAF